MLLENMKIDYSPLVLCNTLFNIVQHKTDIQGFWKDNKGKLYIDNVQLKRFFVIDTEYFNIAKRELLKKELCIFYKDIYNQGIIEYQGGTRDILKNRIEIIENKKPSKNYILALLENNNGLTIYKIDNGQYLIEIYK